MIQLHAHIRPTQPPTLSGPGDKYQPKCGDALQLEVKTVMVHPTGG